MAGANFQRRQFEPALEFALRRTKTGAVLDRYQDECTGMDEFSL